MALVPTIPRIIGRTERSLRALIDRELREEGLEFDHWAVLVSIIEGGSTDVASLAQRLVDDKIAANCDLSLRLIEQVSSMNLVENLEVPRLDGAGSSTPTVGQLVPTCAGDLLYGKLRSRVAEIVKTLFKGLPEYDLVVASRVLNELADRAQRHLLVEV